MKVKGGETSTIVINDNGISVKRTEGIDDRVGIVYPMAGLAFELGRSFMDFKAALKQTRLPVVTVKILSKGRSSTYQLVRMNTGNIENVNLGIIEVYDGYITGYIYEDDILDNNTRTTAMVKPSALNKVKVPITASDEIIKTVFARLLVVSSNNIKIDRKKRIVRIRASSRMYKKPIIYKCLQVDENYMVKSVTIDPIYYTEA